MSKLRTLQVTNCGPVPAAPSRSPPHLPPSPHAPRRRPPRTRHPLAHPRPLPAPAPHPSPKPVGDAATHQLQLAPPTCKPAPETCYLPRRRISRNLFQPVNRSKAGTQRGRPTAGLRIRLYGLASLSARWRQPAPLLTSNQWPPLAWKRGPGVRGRSALQANATCAVPNATHSGSVTQALDSVRK